MPAVVVYGPGRRLKPELLPGSVCSGSLGRGVLKELFGFEHCAMKPLSLFRMVDARVLAGGSPGAPCRGAEGWTTPAGTGVGENCAPGHRGAWRPPPRWQNTTIYPACLFRALFGRQTAVSPFSNFAPPPTESSNGPETLFKPRRRINCTHALELETPYIFQSSSSTARPPSTRHELLGRPLRSRTHLYSPRRLHRASFSQSQCSRRPTPRGVAAPAISLTRLRRRPPAKRRPPKRRPPSWHAPRNSPLRG